MVYSNCFERFFYFKISALGRSVSLFFCHANAKLAPRHWTKIVLKNIANSRFRSSTVGSLLYHYKSGRSKTGIGDIFKNKFSPVSWCQFCIHMTKNKEAL